MQQIRFRCVITQRLACINVNDTESRCKNVRILLFIKNGGYKSSKIDLTIFIHSKPNTVHSSADILIFKYLPTGHETECECLKMIMYATRTFTKRTSMHSNAYTRL